MDYRDRYGNNRGQRRDDRQRGGGGGNSGGYAGYGVYQRGPGGLDGKEVSERDFYKESRTKKPATLNCPGCRTLGSYELTWMLRHKLEKCPGGADAALKAKFEKAQSYMVLVDDYANCKICGKRFEISGIKTMAFL